MEDVTVCIKHAMEKRRKDKVPEATFKRPASGRQPAAKKPSFSVEGTRSRVLVRTGLTGAGQNTALKYTDERSKKAAIAKAKLMVGRRDAAPGVGLWGVAEGRAAAGFPGVEAACGASGFWNAGAQRSGSTAVPST